MLMYAGATLQRRLPGLWAPWLFPSTKGSRAQAGRMAGPQPSCSEESQRKAQGTGPSKSGQSCLSLSSGPQAMLFSLTVASWGRMERTLSSPVQEAT